MLVTPELSEKIANRKLVSVRPDRLENNPLNPPIRFNKKSSSYLYLRGTVRDIEGLLIPVHFSNGDYVLFDGHRRTMIARDLGLTTIEGYRYDGLTEIEKRKLYKILNTASLKYNGAQEWYCFMEGGDCSDSMKRSGDHILKIGNWKDGNGHKYWVTIRDKGKNPETVDIGIKMFINYVKNLPQAKLHSIEELEYLALEWCMNVSSAFKLKNHMYKEEVSPDILLDRVVKQKPVKLRAVVIED
jgi:hypothetical protein|tara:strand:+ start:301 stop:1029 length:729 start_codon:yes stop_codon:yes gene_type:complete